MNLTLFTIPKPFRGHPAIIQMNAIRSWTLLHPRPEILLLGDDEGTKETAEQFGLRHSPSVARNEFGTPLLDSILHEAERLASNEWLCYVNADIILLGDFLPAVTRVRQHMNRFLMIGRRSDLDVTEPLSFEADWEQDLRADVRRRGRLLPAFGSDYFVFPKGLWRRVPAFAVGRVSYDNWLFFDALRSGVPLIDATALVTAVHQNHDYGALGSRLELRRSTEATWNRALSRRDRGTPYLFSMKDSTHLLLPSGLRYRRTHVFRKSLWTAVRYWPLNRLYGLYMGLKRLLGLTYAEQR